MNPLVFALGPIEIHAFAAWILLGLVFSAGAVLILAPRIQPQITWLRWADVLLAGLIGGLIGARIGHVALNWDYFSTQQAEILNLRAGGLDWHGAFFGALLAALITARLRRVPVLPLLDIFALVVPILATTTWRACVDANCGYGVEVGTLANYPSWLVTESPDIYGAVAPRINLPQAGVLLAIPVLLLMLLLTWRGWLPGLRLWIAVIVYGFGMLILDFFRAEYVPQWFGHRADQILDAAVILVALGAVLWQTLHKMRHNGGHMSQKVQETT